MTQKDLKANVISGLRWATLSRSLMQLITWGATLLVIRLLDPEDYGLVTMASVVAIYLMQLSELGLSVALVQRRTTDEQTLRYVFGALLIAGVALFAVTLAVAPLVARHFGHPSLTPLTAVVATQFLIMPFAVIPQATLSIDMKFRQLGMIGLTVAVSSAATTLLLAYLGFGPYALVLGTVLSSAARAIALNIAAPFCKLPRFGFKKVRELISFSGYVVSERTIWYWYAQADVVIVGSLLGAAALGIYSVAKQLASLPLERFAEITNMVALPALASVKDDIARVRDSYVKAVRITALIAFPVFGGIALVAEDLLHVVIGDKWKDAIVILQILCIPVGLRAIGAVSSPAVTAVGKPQVSLKLVAWAAFCVPLAMLIGAQWGLAGIAWGWAVGYPIAFLIGSFHISRALESSMPALLRPLAYPIICTLFMVTVTPVVVAQFLPDAPSLLRLLTTTLVGALAYGGSLCVLARKDLFELRDFSRAMISRS